MHHENLLDYGYPMPRLAIVVFWLDRLAGLPCFLASLSLVVAAEPRLLGLPFSPLDLSSIGS